MQKYLPFLLAAFISSCAENAKKPLPETDTTVVNQTNSLPDKIVGERTNGTVQLLDTISGKPIAMLADNALLDAARPVNGWAEVCISTVINAEQEKSMQLQKDQPLVIGGQMIGMTLTDVNLVTTGLEKNGDKTGSFFGYIAAKSIREGSVIENALTTLLAKQNGRMLPDIQPIIKQFQLQATGFNAPFLEYANYENTVDDPSPMYRTVLVFYKNELIGIVDSRPLSIHGVSRHPLERDFTAYFFNGTDNKLVAEYIKLFNNFINSVD